MKRKGAGDVFPEYYVLRVNDFDKVAKTPLDEWIEFLKTGNISEKATAAGLVEARECLRVDSLSVHDKQAYYRHMESVRHMKSLFETSRDEGYQEGMNQGMAKGIEQGMAKGMAKGMEQGIEQGIEQGREQGREEGREERSMEIARQMKAMGLTDEQIALATGLSKEKIMHC